MPNLGSLSHSHDLWSIDLALATLQTLADLIIGHFLSASPIMPNSKSLYHHHGLEEAPVPKQYTS